MTYLNLGFPGQVRNLFGESVYFFLSVLQRDQRPLAVPGQLLFQVGHSRLVVLLQLPRLLLVVAANTFQLLNRNSP